VKISIYYLEVKNLLTRLIQNKARYFKMSLQIHNDHILTGVARMMRKVY